MLYFVFKINNEKKEKDNHTLSLLRKIFGVPQSDYQAITSRTKNIKYLYKIKK